VSDAGQGDRFRFDWLGAVHSERGPTSHTERTVLTVIFCHLNVRSKTAWPSQEVIARRARISVRQVRRLSEKLQRDGWIETELGRRGGGGQKWKLTIYTPRLPSGFETKGADVQMSSPSDEVRTSSSRGADISDLRCGHLAPEVRTPGCPTNSESGTLNGTKMEQRVLKNISGSGAGYAEASSIQSSIQKLRRRVVHDANGIPHLEVREP
jgi:hypothetical protein